ncbi:MAG: hypothetical protein Q4G11_03940 [Gallicola sp.]|nr:hypothetical protein [Gallicola sp.]
MSFSIIVHVEEGMVLAGDRRALLDKNIYNTRGEISRIERGVFINDSIQKVFTCPNDAGIIIDGSLYSGNKSLSLSMANFIESKIYENTAINEMPQLLLDYFNRFIEPVNMDIYIAGYDKKAKEPKQKIYFISLSKLSYREIALEGPGAIWQGDRVAMDRMFDRVWSKKEEEYIEFNDNPVLWEYFSLQDAIDFSEYALELTDRMMHFWSLPKTVGGGADVLIITPKGSQWVEEKKVHRGS